MMRGILLIAAAFALMALSGCGKSADVDDSPPATTFRIDESCENQESCCADACTDYCVSNSGKYEKHVMNGMTCACFCSR